MDDSTSISSIDFLNNSYHGKNFLKRMSNQDRHAELFRKDLISAMKMPDSETLQPDDYFEIIDSWKLEWERGVQVPVNVNAFTPKVSVISGPQDSNDDEMFVLPKKLLFSGSILDDSFKPLVHELYDLQKQVNSICRYDLDELDSTWLEIFNRSQEEIGEPPLLELDMEKVMEEMEVQCHSKMNEAIRSIEGLGIEYDENVVCDICRSPEGEESNEMVFCDNCDICVHQACYGIQNIPEGSWLCRTCALGIKPKCVLCPMVGGAMKSTKNGDKWAHISCALWVPEVSIGCPEKMEPITNISQIPASRWALVCTLCRERSGACIQCSVRSCKTSFHVTCAFKYGLDLSTVIDDETEDVQMKAYCPKHSGVESSVPNSGGNSEGGLASGESGTINGDVLEPFDKLKDGSDRKSKRTKDGLTEEQRTEIRSQKLKRLTEDFYTFVDTHEASQNLGLPLDVVDAVHAYWTLKRKSRFDVALVAIKSEEEEISTPCQGEEKLVERMKMFVQLRQDLERVRNLCYMVNKREKMKKHERRIKEEIFHRQVNLYSRFLIDEQADEDLQVSNGISGRKFHLSDSDDEDVDFTNFVREKSNGSSGGKNIVSKFLATIDSDENSHSHYGDEDVFSDSHSKREAIKTKKIENLSEERNFLLTAHKSTGTIYDMPSHVLSCSFKENNFLYNDHNFIKSAVAAAAAGHQLDDDDDDDEIFPKSFKYDMKIDDESLDNFCSITSIRGRGRPRKNKRGRPPRISSAAVEEDDSDYYRRLSDEDFDEESDKFSVSKSAKTFDPAPPLPTTVPEKKKRGRKKKSELVAAGSTVAVVKNKAGKRKSGEQVPEARKKRKYTRRKVVKISSPKNESEDKELHKEELKEDENDFKNASSPGSCPGRSTLLGDANDDALGSDVEETNVLFPSKKLSQKEIESEDDEILCREKSGRFIPSDDEEDVDPEIKARREKAAELLKDMEFSDSSTEEEMNFEVKSLADDNTEADDVIVFDMDSQDAPEPVSIESELVTEKDDTKEETTSVQCSADCSSLNNIPLNPAQPLHLGSPSSPLFSSSEEEASDIDDDKHDSKVTGIVNKELLNINARHKLLHKLPIKDFIVSSHIKDMVQNFFSNLGSLSVHSASKLAFNGFKLPQGKIEC